MSADLSTPRLLELAHHYYPANIRQFDEGYSESEQHQRLLRARQEAQKNSEPWKRLFSKLAEALPHCRVEDWSVLFSDDNCWRARLRLPEVVQLEGGGQEFRTVVLLVSILAPVYVRYTSFHQLFGRKWKKPTLFYEDVPETKSIAETAETLVRSELSAQPLPHDALFTPVPDIECGHRALGEAQLIDCLFTYDRW
jgi:hypothetical protein